MVRWIPEEQLTFDIAFALKKVTIPSFRKARMASQCLRLGSRQSVQKWLATQTQL
jgi:hypothetical protein